MTARAARRAAAPLVPPEKVEEFAKKLGIKPPPKRVQKFYLDDDVEVTIRFRPGTVRWTSTQDSVSIATGQTDPAQIQPQAHRFASAPLPGNSAPSWSNCDERGLGFTQGTADAKEVLRTGALPAVATGESLSTGTLDFLGRIEDSQMAAEGVTTEELEGEILMGGDQPDA